jgi:small conductance mechanosensitive channel
VGNTISIKGVSGVVEEVKLAATMLSTEDGEQITIPNKHIVGEVLTNSFECRIVEGQVGISHADDPAKAIDIIRNVIAGFKEIPDDPAPISGIQEYLKKIRIWLMRMEKSLCLFQRCLYCHILSEFKAA